jgi:hypothetical protein
MGEEKPMEIAPHIDRFGDIRKMLVGYFNNVLLKKDKFFSDDFFKSVKKKYGNPIVIHSEDEFHEFVDNFIHSYRFPDDRTVIDRFVAETPSLSEKERTVVLWWKDPVVGIFQVKRTLPDGFVAENLINEVEYIIKPTVILRELEKLAVPGAFIKAKIIPVGGGDYIFSGIQEVFDIPEKEILKSTASIQRETPALAFRDNEERVRKGFELQKRERALFIEYFGGDEVLATGRELNDLWSGFMEFKLKKFDKSVPEGYTPPKMEFPKNLLKSKDVGIVFEEVTGQHYLIIMV